MRRARRALGVTGSGGERPKIVALALRRSGGRGGAPASTDHDQESSSEGSSERGRRHDERGAKHDPGRRRRVPENRRKPPLLATLVQRRSKFSTSTSIVRRLFVRHLAPRKLASDESLHLLQASRQVRHPAVEADDHVVEVGDRLVLIGDLFFEGQEPSVRCRHVGRLPFASARSGADVASARPEHRRRAALLEDMRDPARAATQSEEQRGGSRLHPERSRQRHEREVDGRR